MKFKILLICCIISTATYLFFKTQKKKNPQSIHKITAHFDQRFSDTFRTALNNFLQEQQKISTPSALLAEMIKDRFPVVDAIRIFTFPDKSISLSMTAQEPLVLINQAKILTKLGTIVAHDLFTVDSLSKLANITVKEEKVALTGSFRRFMIRYAQQLHQDYHLIWHNATHIELQNKQKEHVILCSDQTVFSQDLLKHCKAIKQKIKPLPDKKQAWCFDVRFKNQIILFNQKGEWV